MSNSVSHVAALRPSCLRAPPRVRATLATLPLAFVLGSLLSTMPVNAQQVAPPDDEPLLQGIVIDEATGEAIEDARVILVDFDVEATSDYLGRFAFAEPPHGTVTVRIQADGYVVMVEEVEVSSDHIAYVQAYLPDLTAAVGELFVPGQAARTDETRGYARTAADLLVGRISGARGRTGMVGDTDVSILLRGVSSLTQSGEPAIFLDGVRIGGGVTRVFDVLSQIPASDVEDIQILRGPATANHVFGADGAIYVTTYSGSEG